MKKYPHMTVVGPEYSQNSAMEGQLGVQYAYDALTGKKGLIPKKEVLLPNVVMTTQDVNNPNVAKYIYKTSF